MSDLKLKIRGVKRSGDTALDLTDMGLDELPEDVLALTQLVKLNLSMNSISSTKGIGALSNLKELYLQKNAIGELTSDI